VGVLTTAELRVTGHAHTDGAVCSHVRLVAVAKTWPCSSIRPRSCPSGQNDLWAVRLGATSGPQPARRCFWEVCRTDGQSRGFLTSSEHDNQASLTPLECEPMTLTHPVIGARYTGTLARDRRGQLRFAVTRGSDAIFSFSRPLALQGRCREADSFAQGRRLGRGPCCIDEGPGVGVPV